MEKKYLEEKRNSTNLREEIQQLQIEYSNAQSNANLNLEQLSSYIISLEQEIERHQVNITWIEYFVNHSPPLSGQN